MTVQGLCTSREMYRKADLLYMFRLLPTEVEVVQRSSSQTMSLKRGQNLKYRPYAFTDRGAAMLR